MGIKKVNKLIAFCILFLIVLTLAFASQFIDDTQSEFDQGTYDNTTYNGSAIVLSGNNVSGTYTSTVFDAGSDSTWNNISWQGFLDELEKLYAVDGAGDVYSSSDLGATWTQKADNYGRTTATTDMFADENYLYIVAGSPHEVWRSGDKGVTWSVIDDDFTTKSILVGETDSNGNLYVATGPGTVYRSTDQGVTWTEQGDFNGGATNNAKGIAINSSNAIFIVDGSGSVYVSTDSGVNWNEQTSDYGGGSGTDDMYVDSNEHLYILFNKDIYKSTDNGVVWNIVNDTFTPYSNDGLEMTVDSLDNFFIADGQGRIFKSTNYAVTWTEQGDFNAGAGNDPKGIIRFIETTNITFQVKNCSQTDCSDGTFIETNLNNINLTGRYFQYKIYFSSTHSSITPELYNATIDYTILNQQPIISSLNLTPSQPKTTNNLTCSFIITDEDAGDSLTANITWYKNDAVYSSLNQSVTNGTTSSSILDSSDTTKNEEWNCTVLPYDGTAFGNENSSSVTIQNSPPTAPDISITPSSPYTNNNLSTVFNSVSTDADGDNITYNYYWYKDGVFQPALTTSTVSSDLTSKNEVWLLNVTPNDGTDNGEKATDTVTIQNSIPTVASASITPDPAYTTSTLTCNNGTTSDDDGDDVTLSYKWYKNNAVISGETSSTLASNNFAKNNQIICGITPNDGTDNGAAVNSTTLTISNSEPTLDSASISPDPAYTTDTLTCNNGTTSDADEDTVTLSYKWFKDDALISGETTNTLSPNNFAKNNQIICQITPNDGTDNGAAINSTTLTISNSEPTITQPLSLTPSQPKTNNDLTCSFIITDADINDSLTANITWYKNNAVYSTFSQSVTNGTQANSILDSSNTAKNEEWNCTIIPYDETSFGNENSSSVIIQNTAPSISAIPDKSTDSEIYWSYDANASDIDVDEGIDTLTWSINNSMLDINSATGLISDTPLDSDEGVHDINVTVSDGTDEDSTTFVYTITVNRAPNITFINLSPSQPYTTNNLNCSFVVTDDRLEQLTVNISWYKNSILNISANISVNNNTLTSTTLGYENTKKNEEWNCTIIPYDGNRCGEQTSRKVIIQNSPPTNPNISLTPSLPYTNADLNVIFNQVSQDNDTDTITYNYKWYKDNVLQPGVTGSTVSSGLTSKNELWLVNVTPNDGEENGASVQESVTILNSKPSITSTSISPLTAYETTTLTATASGWSDSDNEPENYIYQWYNQSGSIPGANLSTLTGTYFNKGDQIYVNITPYDSDEYGDSKASNTLVIQNSLPSITQITLTTTPHYNTTDDNLIATFTVTDDDNDIIQYNETKWYKNNAEQINFANLTLIDSSYTYPEEEWIFSARLYDGQNWSLWYNSTTLTILESPTLPRLITPSNNSYFNETSVILTYFTPNTGVMNCSIYANESTPPPTIIKTNYNLASSTTIIYNWANLLDNKYYWLVSCTNGTTTVNSSVNEFTIDTTAPTTAPTLTQAGVNDPDKDGNIELSWTADPDANTHNIYRSSTEILNALNLIPIASVSDTSWEDTNTLHNSVYWYAITTVDAAGNENKSVVSNSFNATSNDTIKPKLPTNLTATSFQGITTLTWNKVTEDIEANSDELGLQYKIWYTPASTANLSKSLVNETSTYIKTLTQDSCSSSICSTTHSLSGSALYYYFVTALDDANNENLTLDNSTNGNFANVTATLTPPTETPSGSGGGSGGGSSGGGGGGALIPKKKCKEEWSCSKWYSCINNVQARTCVDVNNCRTEINKPKETRPCGACEEKWQCGDWTPCVNNRQTRVCIDKNDCGTANNKPEEERDCSLNTCSDGVKNYGEVGIDCGGPCGPCSAGDFITGRAIKLRQGEKPNPYILATTIFLLIAFIAITTIKKSNIKLHKTISALRIPLAALILILFSLAVFGPKITGLFTSADETEITELDSYTKYNEKKATTTTLIFAIIVILSLIILIARKKYTTEPITKIKEKPPIKKEKEEIKKKQEKVIKSDEELEKKNINLFFTKMLDTKKEIGPEIDKKEVKEIKTEGNKQEILNQIKGVYKIEK